MEIKNILILLFVVACLSCFFGVGGHCLRDIGGKVEFASIKKDVTIVMWEYASHYNYSYREWWLIDSLKIKQNQEKYNLHRAIEEYQKECKNNCNDESHGGGKLPDSIRVEVLNTSDKQLIKDTVFSCSDYILNGDNIELPSIILP